MTTTEKLKQEMLEFRADMKRRSEEQDKTSAQIKETSVQMKKTEEFIKETGEFIKETGKLVKENSLRMKKTDEQMKRMGIHLGGISNNQGDSAEEFFFNSIDITKKLGGIQYDEKYSNLTDKLSKIDDEFDIVLFNGSEIALIEVKYKAHTRDVQQLLDRKTENFKRMYPKYKEYNYHLGLASFKVNDEVKKEALHNNIMILQRKGNIIETILPASINLY